MSHIKYLIILLLSSALLYSCKNDEHEEIIEPDPSSGMSISLSSSEMIITKLYVEWLTNRLFYKIDNPVSENLKVSWSSDNPNIVAVDEEGRLTIHTFGSATIKATIEGTTISASCFVTAIDTYQYIYRLTLKDKGMPDFDIANPEAFLSSLAVEKRLRRNIAIDEYDLPISSEYIKQIEKIGGTIVSQSKWLNTVSVYCSDEHFLAKYEELPFVEKGELVWLAAKDTYKSQKQFFKSQAAVLNLTEYGKAWDNININKGQVLHQQGFRGEGIDIAVVDEGFDNFKAIALLDNVKIKGAKSFIRGKEDPYDANVGEHGVWVTSCMATNKPNEYIGTAPNANYWLLSTEDSDSEYPIEEDYLVAALEYADSAGVDIANISLSFSWFDLGTIGYKYEDMDGKTAFATKGANMAADKGMFIVCCAGNDNTWVGTPTDSPKVLAVGNIRADGEIGSFTSFGVTVDGRIKPDVVALGSGVNVVHAKGYISTRSGTSYSSPIICGMAASLWQAYPQLTNMELMDVIRKSADRYNKPELPYGYGAPDMEKAMVLANEIVKTK